MALPDIDFRNVRPHEGSRDAGFEELCAQLASLDPHPPQSEFVRKGRGGDAGVECLIRLKNGDECGWQAKYLFSWDASLASQLDESISTALAKHPRLTEYIVCIPFDLPDSRIANRQTARQRWDEWKRNWESKAAADSRKLSISLWDKSALSRRLSTDDPAYAGRLFYWFGDKALTQAWFEQEFRKARDTLGSRYTPETNIELPIRRAFISMSRDPSIDRQISEWIKRVVDAGGNALRFAAGAVTGRRKPIVLTKLGAALDDLIGSLSVPTSVDRPLPLEQWKEALDSCRAASSAALDWAYKLPETQSKHGSRPEQVARHYLFRFADTLDYMREALASDQWRLANAQTVLLAGAAGTGKSHLLADIIEHQVQATRPALLIIGSQMVEGEPWRRIMELLDLPGDLQVSHFLAALDSAAQAAGIRALVCVDAINEHQGVNIWPSRVASFLRAVQPFAHVGVVISCRSTFVKRIIPTPIAGLERIEHRGFEDGVERAADLYLQKRGIVRPGAPNLIPEFNNPLFLKTCCDFLDKSGTKELPRGLRGVSAIFSFYNDAVVDAITERLDLDPHIDPVRTALSGFTEMLVQAGEGYAPKSDVVRFFETVLPSGGKRNLSLLSQFESEGILAIESVPQNGGSWQDLVRFTFERFSDHAIAESLLSKHLDPTKVDQSFASGTPLGDLTFDRQNYSKAGIIEALAVQLPERAGKEIVDLGRDPNWVVEQAFLSSLLWREQKHFTERTFDLVQHYQHADDVRDLLVSISSEPDNPFNATYLHARLSSRPMPERDEIWSTYVARRGNDLDPVDTLIRWALFNGFSTIDEDRAELAATALAWLLSTTSRPVRDRATKALASILAPRLNVAARLLGNFAKVDDLYVHERVFAACYGAVLQNQSVQGLDALAKKVFDLVFRSGKPPLNELLRDHARGIIAYAQSRAKITKGIDPRAVSPPYQSPWPIEFVSEETIESYKQDYGEGKRYGDAIVSSTINDGDFARYVIDHKIDKWTAVSIDADRCPSSQELAVSWLAKFLASATGDQAALLEEMISAARALGDDFSYRESPERHALKLAEERFRASVRPNVWEEFRVVAKDALRHSRSSTWGLTHPAPFNRGWARRWVCKRAHDLGWTVERFGDFERHSPYDRHDHRVERIGKKYQWLALNELLARMADNLKFLGYSWSRDPRLYRGAADIHLRDTDPSLLLTGTFYDGWKEWDRSWWIPAEPRLRALSAAERVAWLQSDKDVLNAPSLIDVVDPASGRHWLVLDTFASWRQVDESLDHRRLQHETWYRLKCVVVEKRQETRVLKALKGQILTSSFSLPEIEFDSQRYLGEFPWHPEFSNIDDWQPLRDTTGSSPAVRATVTSYLCERGGYDYGIDETVRIDLPAPWLARALSLRLKSGQDPVFVQPNDNVCFYDTSISRPGYQAALIDKDAFLSMLDREGLAAVWVISGEKGVFGGSYSLDGFGGRLDHTGVYRFRDGVLEQVSQHVQEERPSARQLQALLGADAPTRVKKSGPVHKRQK